jgi:hypothetical protein
MAMPLRKQFRVRLTDVLSEHVGVHVRVLLDGRTVGFGVVERVRDDQFWLVGEVEATIDDLVRVQADVAGLRRKV